MHHVGSEALSRFTADRHYYEEPNVSAPRVLIAIQPRMYAEVLAFSIGQHRPHAKVSVLGPSEEIEDAVQRLRPHLIVANRVPKALREGASFWVELAEPQADRGIEPLSAQISVDGHSRNVEEVSIEHVLFALDRAEEILLPEAARSEGSS
jgi:hypothetical protein